MNVKTIEEAIGPKRNSLLSHSLYSEIKTPEHLKVFMQHHVFAVWDFMSLLKSLQNHLTCTKVPWEPVGDPEARYLINEIVLAEETDMNQKGARQSHFEMYIDAMEKAGANRNTILNFVEQAGSGTDIYLLIMDTGLPDSVKKFLNRTFSIIDRKKPHEIASAFTFGRENLIPAMFQSIVTEVQENFPEEDLSLFKYYFDRHIELDEDEHGPMALKMVENLCDKDHRKWEEAKKTAQNALDSRITLWNGIEKAIDSTSS